MSDIEIRNLKQDNALKLYHWSRWLLVTLLVVATVLYGAIQVVTLNEVKNTSDRLLSCTDPKGECYKSGDRRSGAAIKTINEQQKQVVTIAAYCAKQPGNTTLEQIEDCVNKELTR